MKYPSSKFDKAMIKRFYDSTRKNDYSSRKKNIVDDIFNGFDDHLKPKETKIQISSDIFLGWQTEIGRVFVSKLGLKFSNFDEITDINEFPVFIEVMSARTGYVRVFQRGAFSDNSQLIDYDKLTNLCYCAFYSLEEDDTTRILVLNK